MRFTRLLRAVALGAGLLLAADAAFHSVASAQMFEETSSAFATDPGENQAMRKFSRGVANILGGVTEFPITVHTVRREDGEFAGLTLGTVKGIGRVLTREAVGVYEVLTFPVGDKKPIIEPEWPMQQDILNDWKLRNPFPKEKLLQP